MLFNFETVLLIVMKNRYGQKHRKKHFQQTNVAHAFSKFLICKTAESLHTFVLGYSELLGSSKNVRYHDDLLLFDCTGDIIVESHFVICAWETRKTVDNSHNNIYNDNINILY